MDRQTKIVVPAEAFDKDSPNSGARAAVARAAHERQLKENRKPAAKVMRYRVTYLGSKYRNGSGSKAGIEEQDKERGVGITHTVDAVSETEAWAKYCDLIKSWPSPRQANRTIECLGPAADAFD